MQTHAECSPIIAAGPLCLYMNKRTVYMYGLLIRLKPKEYQFLEKLCLNKGRFVSRKELITYLYGKKEKKPKPNVISVYANYVRRKLDVPKDGLIESHWGKGYRLLNLPPTHTSAE